MKQPTIIDQQYESGNELITYLKDKQELTLLIQAENNFSKNILLSAASYFENEITETIVKFAETHSEYNELIVSIIKQKAISRQYHTYFQWDGAKNANSFFTLFGDQFKNKMSNQVKQDKKLEESIKAFYQIGQERNKMVHQNFAEIVLDKTAEEIYTLYQIALYFIDSVKSELIKKSEEAIYIDSTISKVEQSWWQKLWS